MSVRHVLMMQNVQKNMEIHAAKAYPSECCGLLFGNSRKEVVIVKEAVRMDNAAGLQRSGSSFSMDPLRMFAVEKDYEKRSLEIVGCYHSHPDQRAVLSREDREQMIPGQLYAILPSGRTRDDGMRMWILDGTDEQEREIS